MIIRHKIALLIFTLSIYLFTVTFCVSYAETVSSTELIENAKSFDGKTAIYRGEAVTAILGRGEYSWVNLNDGNNAIGIWCRSEALNGVKFVGDYKHKGDILEVEGVFHRACPEHGGELDIHAERIKIAESGFARQEKLNTGKIKVAILIFFGTLLIIALFRRRL